MALWQYHCHIVPNVDLLSERLKDLKSEDDLLEDNILWNEYQAPKSLFDPLCDLLGKSQSWSKDIDLYGYQEHDCVKVLTEREEVVSVSLRIDFTRDYTSLLEQVIEFCIYKGLAILDDKCRILPMNALRIKSLIETSEQYHKLQWLADK